MSMGDMDNPNRRRNLGFFFDQAIARVPDKVAIIDLFGGRERCTTYRQLDERMDSVARMLARLGVRAGERVAMLVGNRTEFIEFFFGSMRAGAIPLPLNTRLAAGTLEHIIADAACVLAIVDPASHREAAALAARLPLRHRLLLDERAEGFLAYEDEMAKPGPPVEPPPIADDAQAFQPYTSGSTGRPKGAIMTHHGMLWYVAYNQRYWPSSESDRGLVALPLFHKNALRGTVKPMLHAGGSFVLMPAYEPRAYLDALAKYRCTYSRGVAAVFTMFLQHRDYLRTLDLSALRGMTIGSAVVTPELLDAVERALPHVKVSESYGLTEGGSPLRAPIDGRPVPRGSPGVPAPDIELRLIDAQGCDAEEGELLIRCPYVCLGYYNEPEITRAKLTDGWLHTGDIFCKDKDGFFYFRSRVDDMFSCGGENVYPEGGREPPFRPSRCGECRGRTGAASGEGLRAGRDGDRVRRLNRHGGASQSLLPGQGAGLFASAFYRHRRGAAAERSRQDRPQHGAGEARRGVPSDERGTRAVAG